MEETISLEEIYQTIKKYFSLIVGIAIATTLVAAILSYFVLTPVYQSSSQFIVNSTKQEDANQAFQVDTNTIRTNVELINTYNVIITSAAILTDVIEELELDTTPSSLAKNISVSSEQNSQVVTVSVKDPDPAKAVEIANTVVEIFKSKIVDLMNVDNVEILTAAELSDNPQPVDPNPKLNIAIGAVIGLMIGVGVAFLLQYLDKAIHTEKDIEEKLGLPLIGVVSRMGEEDMLAGTRSGQKHGKQGSVGHV